MVGPTPPYGQDPSVDAYFERLPAWQQAVCQAVRDLVHAADPDVVETIKRTVRDAQPVPVSLRAIVNTRLASVDRALVPWVAAAMGRRPGRCRTVAGRPLDCPPLCKRSAGCRPA